MPKDDLMNLSDVARLAGVNKSAVTNWRDRYEDFPKPVPTSERGIFFKRQAVLAWLGANRPDSFRLEQWLWEAACQIRGPLDAPKFKDYILPLIFLKRLSDVFDDEVAHLTREFGDAKMAATLVEQDHKLVRFYLPASARWSVIARKTTGLGEHLTDAVRAIARENPRLSGVINVTNDFNATAAGQRIVDDGRLAALVQVLN